MKSNPLGPAKSEKRAHFSSENSRNVSGYGISGNSGAYINQGPPSVFSQVQIVQNLNNRNTTHSAHIQENQDGPQILAYGQPKEKKKGSSQAGYYDILVGQNQLMKQNTFQSQSQRAAQAKSFRNQPHLIYQGNSIQAPQNTSLFSQISLKDNSPSKNKKDENSSRNQSMLLGGVAGGLLMFNEPNHHNLSHQTQPLPNGNQKGILKNNQANDRMPRRYVQLGAGGASVTTSRKSNENIQIHPALNNGTQDNSQGPILNINTASDINIYNNSFIVNTAGNHISSGLGSKKQSHSQNQSRSNSLKRNGNTTSGVPQTGYNPSNIRKQMTQGKFVNLNSAGNNAMQSGINLQNLLALNNDYQSRVQPQQSYNSNQRLSATDQLKKYNQIAEAYTTTNFFSGGGMLGASNTTTNGGVFTTQGGQQLRNATSQRKIIKLSNRKHHKQSSSSANTHQQEQLNQKMSQIYPQSIAQQQSYTQSFDLLPFNSSTDLSQSSNGQNAGKSKIKFTGAQKVKNSSSLNRIQNPTTSNEFYALHSQSPNIGGNRLTKTKAQSQSLFVLGKKKILEKDYTKAIALFTQAIQLDQLNSDAKFYRALSHLDSGQNKEAIAELKQIIQISSKSHSPICHILLSIGYKRINEQNLALSTLNECILLFPQYPDAFLARGQALLIIEKYDLALMDFQQYTQLMPSNGMGFVGVGDSHKFMKQWQLSITAYSRAIQLFSKESSLDEQSKKGFIMQGTLKRGLAYYHLQMHQQAMSDFQSIVKADLTSIKAHFYIGKILSKQYLGEITHAKDLRPPTSKQRQKIQNEAILHFEQVVKHHQATGEVYAGNALFEIAKLRLQDKDFYEAYFNLKRAVDSNFNSKRLQLYKDFTEGVLYLIKRKIKKGVQILSDLLEVLVNTKDKKDQRQLDYLRHQSYIYRAYGYVAIEKYEVALQDIKKAKKISKLDAASIYNKLLGKGILRMDHEDYLMATKYFNKASMKFPLNKDSYCLYIISIVRSYSYSHQGMTVDQDDKKDKVWQAKEFMDHAIKHCCSKVKIPSLYFFRGLLYFQMHMFYQAIKDFNVSIDEEEEPTAAYYLARGRTYACLSILTEAMKDLSIAINLDETLQEAYIYRGKCAYLLGDNNLAFLDFQRLILTDPKNPMVHVYAGNLLMTTGAYQDAIKAFLNADTVQKTAVAAFQRGRCFCALTDLENAKMQFKIALQICKTEQLISIDSQVISALLKVINATSMSEQQREKSGKQIQQALDILAELIALYQSDKISSYKKKDSILNIQVIPNVKRIKIEKVAVAKEILSQNNNEGQSKVPDVSINTEDLMAQPTIDLDSLKNIPLYSYYYENVFSLEDLFLFRAVFQFYQRDYQSAIESYESCAATKYWEGGKHSTSRGVTPHPGSNHDHCAESIMAYSQTSTPLLSMNSSKTDLSDVGLCSLNVHETNYNILLCYILIKNYPKALEKINEIIGQAPGKYQRHFFLLRGILNDEIGLKDKAIKDYAKYQKQEPKLYEWYFKEGKDLNFEPFPVKNRLCSRFESVKISHLLPHTIREAGLSPKICFKPSFSMPFIKPPNMIPNIDEESIQSEFSLKQIDAPMPEAPWIRRWGGRNYEGGNSQSMGGIIKFTDNILMQEEDEGSFDDEEEGKIQDFIQSTDGPLEYDEQGSPGIAHKVKARIQPQDDNQSIEKSKQAFHDESPYLQSIEVNKNLTGKQGRPILNKRGISEHIIQNTDGGQNSMMVYQFVGDAVDVDQLSDKHKISLFDESRYDDLNIGTIQSEKESQEMNGKMILKRDGLEAGDSLYEEGLLNQDSKYDEEGVELGNEDEDDDDDSSFEYDDEQNEKQIKGDVDTSGGMQVVGDSMVLMGGNAIKKRKSKNQQQRPAHLVMSLDNEETYERQRIFSQLDLTQEIVDEKDQESIFRSKQSSKR